MSKLLRVILLLAVLASGIFIAAPAGAADIAQLPPGCGVSQLNSGALILICVPPDGWNGDLIVFAHGYVAPDEPLGFYNLEIDGTSLPGLVLELGYAFAYTSYSRNGLAILEGVQDVRDLVNAFKATVGEPRITYIAGASEGGAVTALSAERSADLFDAGLSLCGPIGDFRKQIDYWGDFRVLFDAFFPGVLPPDAMNIPDELTAGWGTIYQPAVLAALQADYQATGGMLTAQLIHTAKAAIDRSNLTTAGNTTAGLLWYNVFATNDGKERLGGIPFDNSTRVYRGSLNDVALNASVQRFTADPQALAAMLPYNTKGKPGIPLITMHTRGDEIVPFWHQTLYRKKLIANGTTGVLQIPINRYGHCNFTTEEVLVGFSLMVMSATGQQMYVPAQYDITEEFARMQQGANDYQLDK